jgi:hypothetical protein
MGRKAINLLGEEFGKLKVLSRAGTNETYGATWNCLCECGRMCVVSTRFLRKGFRKTCGNHTSKDKGKWLEKRIRARIYKQWVLLIDRCERPINPAYHRYGGRGIKVCERWHDFELFYNDTKELRGRGLSLDRIDNDGDYKPDNCQFVNRHAQNRNKSDNRNIECNGETHCLTDWASMLGMSRSTLRNRLALGWSIEDALTKPVATRKNHRGTAMDAVLLHG